MIDHFEVLGIERSAALDEELVRARFHELSRDLHPDADGGDEDAFAKINEAQRVLASSASRLRHLLELQGAGESLRTGEMSAELMEMFAQLGEVLSKADTLISKRESASSAVARALLAGEEMEVQSALMAAGGQVMGRRRELESRLGEVACDDLAAIAAAAQELAFLEKWQRGVQQRLGALV